MKKKRESNIALQNKNSNNNDLTPYIDEYNRNLDKKMRICMYEIIAWFGNLRRKNFGYDKESRQYHQTIRNIERKMNLLRNDIMDE